MTKYLSSTALGMMHGRIIDRQIYILTNELTSFLYNPNKEGGLMTGLHGGINAGLVNSNCVDF